MTYKVQGSRCNIARRPPAPSFFHHVRRLSPEHGMPAPGRALTGLAAALYVLSGVTQPLLMTLVRLRRARPGCRPSCLLASRHSVSTLAYIACLRLTGLTVPVGPCTCAGKGRWASGPHLPALHGILPAGSCLVPGRSPARLGDSLAIQRNDAPRCFGKSTLSRRQ